MSQDQQQPLLQVSDLKICIGQGSNATEAVKGISLEKSQGETIAVVGESGSGKSVTALSLIRLIPSPPVSYPTGSILFKGQDLLKANERDLRNIRGSQIAYVFQEPGTSLNPVFTVGHQIAEAIHLHRPEVKDVQAEIIEALD